MLYDSKYLLNMYIPDLYQNRLKRSPMKKPPINSFTGLRFFLILYIVLAHFCQVATQNEFLLTLLKQHNLVVGAFFVLSGYVMTYAYTDFYQNTAPNIPLIPFLVSRLSRIYPPYAFTLLLFSPMFIFVDLHYGHGLKTLWYAFVHFSLMQAWLPSLAELWNSPTWFLSALLFTSLLFPIVIGPITRLSKRGIYGFFALVLSISLLIKVFYSMACGWQQMEGLVNPQPMNLFNFVRFNPLVNSLEFLLGIASARLFMLEKDKGRSFPGLLLFFLISLLFLRYFYPLNDMICRTLFFIPLFCLFLLHLHNSQGLLARFLSLSPLAYLGNISFSIYILHGVIGQLFYKKAIASRIWDAPIPFPFFLASVFIAAPFLYHFVEEPSGKVFKSLFLKPSSPAHNRN